MQKTLRWGTSGASSLPGSAVGAVVNLAAAPGPAAMTSCTLRTGAPVSANDNARAVPSGSTAHTRGPSVWSIRASRTCNPPLTIVDQDGASVRIGYDRSPECDRQHSKHRPSSAHAVDCRSIGPNWYYGGVR